MLTKDKKKLLAILTLKEKMQIDAKLTISPSGVLILSLPSGGTIRDSGKQLYFSKFDPQAEKMAQELAKIKWGKMCRAEGNSIVFKPGHGTVAGNTKSARCHFERAQKRIILWHKKEPDVNTRLLQF